MQRFRTSGTSILGSLVALPQLKRKTLNSWAAVQDTYLSTKDIFERHKVVFTIGTSIASVATAWAGYSLRQVHQMRVDQRLEMIENAMRNNVNLEHSEIKKIAGLGSISAPACFATAGTSLIIGYGLGWRGGRWYANRKFRKEQLKLLGQIKPRRWQFQFLRRRMTRSRVPESAVRTSEKTLKDAPTRHSSGQTHQSEQLKN